MTSKTVRKAPRPISERDPDDVIRCSMCDWQLIDGEGIKRTRPCCFEGLKFDLDHGLTLVGGTWRWLPAHETTGWYVAERLKDGTFRRSALGHIWESNDDAHRQRDELAKRYPRKIFAVTSVRSAVEPIAERCPNCGKAEVSTFTADNWFLYGVSKHFRLCAESVLFFRCMSCNLEYTGEDGENKRTEAIRAHLARVNYEEPI